MIGGDNDNTGHSRPAKMASGRAADQERVEARLSRGRDEQRPCTAGQQSGTMSWFLVDPPPYHSFPFYE